MYWLCQRTHLEEYMPLKQQPTNLKCIKWFYGHIRLNDVPFCFFAWKVKVFLLLNSLKPQNKHLIFFQNPGKVIFTKENNIIINNSIKVSVYQTQI